MKRSARPIAFALFALVLILVIGCVFHAEGAFFLPGTHADTLWQLSGYGILACGLTVVIVTGGIDLSVGSVVALCGVCFASMVIRQGWPGYVAVPLAVGAGALCGVCCGVLIAFARVQPFVATLAMMAFARGLAKSDWVSQNTKITRYPSPELFEAINHRVDVGGFGVSAGTAVLLVLVGLTLVILRTLPIGVAMYAIGDNAEAARVAGVPVRRTKVFAYSYCGALAGIAGVLFAALERQGNPDAGVGYELTAIAMVVIGGTSLAGGRGGVLLTLIGALTIGYLRKILDINAVGTPTQLMLTGTIVVLAVLVQGVRLGRRGE